MITRINNTFTRFLIVGVFNTAVGLTSAFMFLHLVGLGYWVSTCLGNGIGAVVSYLLNRQFTFRSSSSYRRSFGKFIAVILLCYFISYGFSYYLTTLLLSDAVLKFNPNTVSNIAVLGGAALYTITNYLGHKFFTFK